MAIPDKKPCAWEGSSLIDHLEGAWTQAGKLRDSYYEVAASRLKVASGGRILLSSQELKNAIKITTLLHDIGKAADLYQNNYDCDCSPLPGRNKYFNLHEVPSAVIMWRVCSHNGSNNCDLSMLTATAVLMHMDTMRDFETIKQELERRQRIWTFNGARGQISAWLERKGLSGQCLSGISTKDAIDLLEQLYRFGSDQNNSKWMKLYTLFLAPTIIGDNLEAEISRRQNNGRERKFTKELKEAINDA